MDKEHVRKAIQDALGAAGPVFEAQEDCLEKATIYLVANGYEVEEIVEKDDNSCLALFVYDVICYTTELEV